MFFNLHSYYTKIAVITFNSVLVFILVNLLCLAIEPATDTDEIYETRIKRDSNRPVRKSANQWFYTDGGPIEKKGLHPFYTDWFNYHAIHQLSPSEAFDMMQSFTRFADLGFDYDPYTAYSPPLYQSSYLNVIVDSSGLALRASAPVMPIKDSACNVYLLGGSTTFGWLVPDSLTIASFINQYKGPDGKGNFVCSNYGRPYYYPSQELALLVQLLKAGQRPDCVIFIDGVNTGDKTDIPFHAAALSYKYQLDILRKNWIYNKLDFLPLVRVIKKNKLKAIEATYNIEERFTPPADSLLANRFEQNYIMAKALAEAYNFKLLYVLQPHYIQYPAAYFRDSVIAQQTYGVDNIPPAPYRILKNKYPDLWVMDSVFEQFGFNQPAIIDNCHYSPAFNQFLAGILCSKLKKELLNNISCGAKAGPATGNKYDLSQRQQFYRSFN